MVLTNSFIHSLCISLHLGMGKAKLLFILITSIITSTGTTNAKIVPSSVDIQQLGKIQKRAGINSIQVTLYQLASVKATSTTLQVGSAARSKPQSKYMHASACSFCASLPINAYRKSSILIYWYPNILVSCTSLHDHLIFKSYRVYKRHQTVMIQLNFVFKITFR